MDLISKIILPSNVNRANIDLTRLGKEVDTTYWPIVRITFQEHYLRKRQLRHLLKAFWNCYDRAYKEKTRMIVMADLRKNVYIKPEFFSLFAKWMLGMRQLTMYLLHSSVVITESVALRFVTNNIVMKIAKRVRPNYVAQDEIQGILWLIAYLITEFETIDLVKDEQSKRIKG